MYTHAITQQSPTLLVLDLEATDFDALFVGAARSVAELEGTPTADPLGPWVLVHAEAPDRKDLLVAWLNELIDRAEVDHMVCPDAEIVELTETSIRARVRGRPIESKNYQLVRAVTDACWLAMGPDNLSASVHLELKD